MGEKLRSRLFDKLKVKKNEIYEISGPIDLTFLKKLAGAVKGHEKMRYAPIKGYDHLVLAFQLLS